MKARIRRGFGVIELLVVLAILAVIGGVLMSAVQGGRFTAGRLEAANHLQQLGVGARLYLDNNGTFPLGNDTKNKNQSAFVSLLPYIDQGNLKIEEKSVPVVKIFLDPRDPVPANRDGIAGSNFLFCAGSEPGLENNNGPCPADGKGMTLEGIINGATNTMLMAATVRGDGGKKAVDVKRQHVALKKEALKGIQETAGVQDWKDDKNIVGTRCSNWADGRFLQGTFTATRAIDDEAPDVDCGGAGGLSALRSLGPVVPTLYCDGRVSNVSRKISLKMWKMMANCKNETAFLPP